MNMSNARGVASRTIVALAILGLAYGVLVAFPRYQANNRDKPLKELAELRASIANNLAATHAYEGFVADGPTSHTLLSEIDKQSSDSIDKLRGYVSMNTEWLTPEVKDSLSSVTDAQTSLQDNYQARLAVAGKVIEYIPQIDLESHDIREQSTEIAQRSRNAANALDKLHSQESLPLEKTSDDGKLRVAVGAGSFSLSPEARRSLKESSDCFATLARYIEAGSFESAIAQRATCYAKYEDSRAEIIRVITDVYRSQEAELAIEAQLKLLQTLDYQLPKVTR